MAHAPVLRIDPERERSEKNAADNPGALEQNEPVLSEPIPDPHAGNYTPAAIRWAMMPGGRLNRAGNILFCQNQRSAWNQDDPFVRSATRCGRQVRDRAFGYIGADDCEVTGLKLENVRATAQRGGSSATSVRVRAKSS